MSTTVPAARVLASSNRMHIAIFDPVGSYFSAPTLRCMLEEFEEAGHSVDVFLRRGAEHLATVSSASAQPFPVPPRLWTGDCENTLRQWKWFIEYRSLRAHRILTSGRYDLAIGVNPEGVIAAHRHWKRAAIPFVYLSFEMTFKDELRSPGERWLKREEAAASADAALIIIQDEWRARLLSQENKVPVEKMAFLPVAPRGGAIPSRSPEIRQRLGIGEEHVFVIHFGAFKNFTCADWIVESFPYWPRNYLLVLNTYYPLHRNDPFVSRLQDVGRERVRITSGELSAAELDRLVASADIGLALYQPDPQIGTFGGKNIRTMGLSSGKLSVLARNGVPVVFGGNPELRSQMSSYRFGEYAAQPADIPGCLARVWQHREELGRQARVFFDECLDFTLFWPSIWRRILRVTELGARGGQTV